MHKHWEKHQISYHIILKKNEEASCWNHVRFKVVDHKHKKHKSYYAPHFIFPFPTGPANLEQ